MVRRPNWRLAALALGLSLSAPVLLAQESGPDELERKLGAATDAMIARLIEQNPEGDEYTIAALPLIEPGQKRMRRINTKTASIVTRRLTNNGPQWLRVLDRLALPSILEEHRLWVADFMRQEGETQRDPGGLLERADLLVVGTLTCTPRAVTIELRTVLSKTARIVAAPPEPLSLDVSAPVRELLRFIKADETGDLEDIAPVSEIHIALTAQRADLSGGLVNEWQVKKGETLEGGDQFNIRFMTDADAYVYIFCHGSGGEVDLLFPTDDWEEQFERRFGRKARPQDNYCYAEEEYWAPGPDEEGVQRFYKLDNVPGRNVLYFCANRTEVRNIRSICESLKTAPSDKERLRRLKERFHFDHVETFEFNQE